MADLLLGLKGTISELELHIIKNQMTSGSWQNRNGATYSLVRDPSGVLIKNARFEVRHTAVRDLSKVRIGAHVMRTFAHHGLALASQRPPWQLSAAMMILKNSAYVGALSMAGLGRRYSQTTAQRPQESRVVERTWRTVVKEKYLGQSMEDIEKIQPMLRDNRAEYQHINNHGMRYKDGSRAAGWKMARSARSGLSTHRRSWVHRNGLGVTQHHWRILYPVALHPI